MRARWARFTSTMADIFHTAQLAINDVIVVSGPAEAPVDAPLPATFMSMSVDQQTSAVAASCSRASERRAMACTPFNVFCGKGSLVGAGVCLLVNGRACMRMHLKASGEAVFAHGSLYPPAGVLAKLPLKRGQNRLEARLLHPQYAHKESYTAQGSIWSQPGYHSALESAHACKYECMHTQIKAPPPRSPRRWAYTTKFV